MENLIRVGITHGDINGIGYEVIIKTLLDARLLAVCTPIVYGSTKVMEDVQRLLRVQKHGRDIRQTEVCGVRFVPLVGEKGWAR